MSSLVYTDTALVAQEASIDINNMLMGKPKDVTAMRNLAVILNDLIGADATDDTERSPMDPVALSILHTAMMEVEIKNSTVRELLTDVKEIAKMLSSNDPMKEVSHGIMIQMRDFCSHLSKTIVKEYANRRNWDAQARTRRW